MRKDTSISLESTGAYGSNSEINGSIAGSLAGDLYCLTFLTEEERRQVLIEWNLTDAPYTGDLCIHQIFESQVEKSPDAIALVYEDKQWSYRELNHRANQLAHHLVEEGVRPDSLVGLFLERSFEMVVGILGILKAGGAYVPLDPDYPKARIEYMLEDGKLDIVLTKISLEEKIKESSRRNICLDDSRTLLLQGQYNKENPSAKKMGLTPLNLAYVIYTSGSTGNPKGVMVEHHALVNRIEWMRDQYGCDDTDAILQKTPFSFDVSVWEFFLPLVSGARIVLAKPGGHKDPIYLSELIRDESITKLHFVPSMLNAILTVTKLAECISLKQLFCSGEALQPSCVDMYYKQGVKAELHNLYGPTEASIDVSYWACSENDSARNSIPIGRPINNIKLYVFDQNLKLTKPGDSGELYIGGVGLARGYLNRSDLTAEKFISNPLCNDKKNRLYKTGDLCRHLPDGNIEFLGRMDHQVKIRGFRIELGEIENNLLRHASVNEAAVLSKDMPAGGQCLVAYIACHSALLVSEIRAHLEQSLPDYMIPSYFTMLSELPLTTSGKIDRKALLSHEIHNFNNSQNSTNMSFVEHEVYKIWQQILGHDDLDLDDDLFKVGGDSIAAVQIFTKINNEFGVNIYLEELFSSDHFSIRWLVTLIEKYQIDLIGNDEYSLLLEEIDALSEEDVAKLLLEQ